VSKDHFFFIVDVKLSLRKTLVFRELSKTCFTGLNRKIYF